MNENEKKLSNNTDDVYCKYLIIIHVAHLTLQQEKKTYLPEFLKSLSTNCSSQGHVTYYF